MSENKGEVLLSLRGIVLNLQPFASQSSKRHGTGKVCAVRGVQRAGVAQWVRKHKDLSSNPVSVYKMSVTAHSCNPMIHGRVR